MTARKLTERFDGQTGLKAERQENVKRAGGWKNEKENLKMINESSVKNEAEALCGESIDSGLIKSACRRVRRMLKADAEEYEAYEEPLEFLAALYAVRDHIALDRAVNPQEISAGEVSIKNGLTAGELDRVIKRETEYLSECLDDPEFIFMECEYEESEG